MCVAPVRDGLCVGPHWGGEWGVGVGVGVGEGWQLGAALSRTSVPSTSDWVQTLHVGPLRLPRHSPRFPPFFCSPRGFPGALDREPGGHRDARQERPPQAAVRHQPDQPRGAA